jgi:hypothetical protein
MAAHNNEFKIQYNNTYRSPEDTTKITNRAQNYTKIKAGQ